MVVRVGIDHLQAAAVHTKQLLDQFIRVCTRVGQALPHLMAHPVGEGLAVHSWDEGIVHVVVRLQLPDGLTLWGKEKI